MVISGIYTMGIGCPCDCCLASFRDDAIFLADANGDILVIAAAPVDAAAVVVVEDLLVWFDVDGTATAFPKVLGNKPFPE